MNKTILFSLILGAAASGSVFAQSKMDAGAVMASDIYKAVRAGQSVADVNFKGMPFTAEGLLSRADRPVGVILGLNDGHTAADIEKAGLEVTVDLGDIVVASGPMDLVIALENNDAVKSISFGEQRQPMMDRTRRFTGADAIQTGEEGLSKAYKGEGILCGIFDTGLDPNHCNFLDCNGESRVKAVWNYMSNDGSARAYLNPDAIGRFATDRSNETHGTHTLGIMAGSYNGNVGRVATINDDNRVSVSSAFKKIANPYYGMAPEADIAIGCGTLYDANILAGVQKIISLAEELGKPAVVNLSLGGNIGPHDGTDNTSRALAKLGEKAVIFIAAGNEGEDKISIDHVLGGPAQFATLLDATGNYSGYIDIWSNSSATFTFIPVVQDLKTGATTEICQINNGEGTVKVANTGVTATDYTNAVFDKAFTTSSMLVTRSKNTTTNNRYNVRVNVSVRINSTTNKDGANYALGFKIVGDKGQHIQLTSKVDGGSGGTVFLSDMGQQGFISGSTDFTISSMACGENVVCVGAWNGRYIWPVVGGGALYWTGEGYDVGAPAPYSSYGVLADGRSLPDLVAPGTAVISSISTPYMKHLQSQYGEAFSTYVSNTQSAEQTVNGRVNYWDSEQGTSMATPAVAGGVALWLQAKPTLNVDEVKEIIRKTSTKDDLCPGSYPAAKVGAGKFNALDGLKTILGLPLGVVDAAAEDNFMVTVNGDNVEAFSSESGALEATLVNVQGAVVATAFAGGNTVAVPTAGLCPGIYVLSVQTPAGRFSRKIAIRR